MEFEKKLLKKNNRLIPVDGLDSKIIKLSIFLGLIAIVSAVSAIGLYAKVFSGALAKNHDVWGQFGDFFGGTLNPLFSLLSLVAILITLFFQAKELSSSTSALREQANYLKLQSFESTFFSMIMMHNENLKALDLDETEKEKYIGRSVFRIIYRRLNDLYLGCHNTNEFNRIKESYEVFYRKNHRFICHYIGTLNQIFAFINKRADFDKEEYWMFIKAQLTEYELAILFYHSLTQADAVDFDILKTNKIFEHLPGELLLNKSSHIEFI